MSDCAKRLVSDIVTQSRYNKRVNRLLRDYEKIIGTSPEELYNVVKMNRKHMETFVANLRAVYGLSQDDWDTISIAQSAVKNSFS